MGQPSARVDAVDLGGFGQGGDDAPVFAAAVVAGEEAVFAIERDLPVILPMSGRNSKFGIGSIRGLASLLGSRRSTSAAMGDISRFG